MTGLADCDHPEDQQQPCLAVNTGSRFLRCADCGAVRYGNEPYWVRPVLAAHAVHAERDAAEERLTELTDDQIRVMREAAERLLATGSSVASYHPAEALALLDEVLRGRARSSAMEVPQPTYDDVDPETIIRMHLDGRPSRKYIPVDGVELKEIVDVAVARATEVLTSDEWDDNMLPEDRAINEAFPTRSGKHDAYAEAMRLVGAKRSKGALVKLVTWLIVERDAAKEGR